MMRVINASDGFSTFVLVIYKIRCAAYVPYLILRGLDCATGVGESRRPGLFHDNNTRAAASFSYSSLAGCLGDVHVLPYL